MSNLPEDDPAFGRYSMLCDALGGVPVGAMARMTLARVCASSDDRDVSLLALLISERVDCETKLYRGAVEMIATKLATAKEGEGGDAVVSLPPETVGYLVGLTRYAPRKLPVDRPAHPLDESHEDDDGE